MGEAPAPGRSAGSPAGTQHDELVEFFAGLPHRVAGAGLSPDDVVAVADLLDDLVQSVESAGYPPVEVDGPDPERFPPGSERIAAASNQLHGLLLGLDDSGWGAGAGADTVAERCRSTRDRLLAEHHLTDRAPDQAADQAPD